MPQEPFREVSYSSRAPSVSDDDYTTAVSQPIATSEDVDPRGFRGGHAHR
jgi:hypothetical protein